MSSDLTTTDATIDPTQVLTKKIKVKRLSNCNNVGPRMWFVVLGEDGELYQRWSLIMNPTDALLSVIIAGDTLDITYYVEELSDDVFKRSLPFSRNNIITAKLV
jgi:hypothetical protein